jgi:ribose transport system permease protein
MGDMRTDERQAGGAADAGVVGRLRQTGRLQQMVSAAGSLIGLLVLVVVLGVLSENFLTVANLRNISVQVAVIAILAFGQTYVIVAGGIDLSVGSVAGLAGVVMGWTFSTAGWPPVLTVLAGLAAGLLAGLVNALLIGFGRLPAFIATLAMLSMARGLALVISNGIPLDIPPWVASLGSGEVAGVPYPTIVMLVALVITAFILRLTYAGRAMYAIGGNSEAARLSGVRVRRQQFVIYGLSGLFAAAAGILLAGRLASAQPQAGTGYELDAIAAVVIGGASLAGGSGSALGTLVGALILGVLRNGLTLLNVSAFWQQFVIGAVIAIAVLLDTLRRRSAR